jgi:hypothetical protein
MHKRSKKEKMTCELKHCVTKIDVDTEGNEVLRLSHCSVTPVGLRSHVTFLRS